MIAKLFTRRMPAKLRREKLLENNCNLQNKNFFADFWRVLVEKKKKSFSFKSYVPFIKKLVSSWLAFSLLDDRSYV